MSPQALYCEQCGQEYTTGKVSFRALVVEFLEEVFSLDSKLLRTAGALARPGRLTNAYFAGRHRRYAHPIRLFFLTAVIFFALLAGFVQQFEDTDAGLSSKDNQLNEKVHRSQFMTELDRAADSTRARLPSRPEVEPILDTLRGFLDDPRRDDRELTYFYLTKTMNIGDTSIFIDYQDLVSLPRDSFYAKYHIEGLMAQTFVRQSIRLQTDPQGFLNYLLGQMVWMVLLMMPFLAIILKLLYIRRRRFYIEHLIFSFHYHAFGFVLFSIPLLLTVLPIPPSTSLSMATATAFSLAALLLILYLFVAMRRVYQQGFGKTLVKFTILNFLYILVFSLMIFLFFVASVILY